MGEKKMVRAEEEKMGREGEGEERKRRMGRSGEVKKKIWR